MGIEVKLKQISPNILEKLLNYSDFFVLFTSAEWLPDSIYWQKYQRPDLPPYILELMASQQNVVTEILQDLQVNKPKEYESLRSEIPLILEKGKILSLDLHKEWHLLSFLNTGYKGMNLLPFLIEKNGEDNLLAVNAILCGTETTCQATYGFYRYLIPDEVTQIAEVLKSFSKEIIKERFNRGSLRKLDIYTVDWGEEEEFDLALEYCEKLANYYQSAAKQGNAMLLYFT